MSKSKKLKTVVPPPPPKGPRDVTIPSTTLAPDLDIKNDDEHWDSTGEWNGKHPSEMAAYSDLFSRMTDPILIVEIESGKILQGNDACERVFGAEPDLIRGQNIYEWVDSRSHQVFEKHLRVAKRRQMAKEGFDVLWRHRDGDILVMEILPCRLLLTNGAEVFQVIAKNVTRERRAAQELLQLNKRLESLSTTDEMTGLANYRRFMTELHREHERSDRYRTSYAILFCDVDYFKTYNDLNGHQAGDQALERIGQVLRGVTRNTDLPSRYGGEEFVVLCPGVDWEGGFILGDRIRIALEEAGIPNAKNQPGGKFTMSIGVASYPNDGLKAEEILKAADRALYSSKNAGRNRVTAAQTLARRKNKKSA